MSDSVQPHRRQPTRLPRPWDSPGKPLEWVAISISNAWKWKVKVKSLGRARLLVTPWTEAYQAPLSWDFTGWNGVPLPSPAYVTSPHKSLGIWGSFGLPQAKTFHTHPYSWVLTTTKNILVWPWAKKVVEARGGPLWYPLLCISFLLHLLCILSCNNPCVCMLVAKSRPAFFNPMDCSPPGSFVHGILQARILKWVAIPGNLPDPGIDQGL